MNRQTTSYKDLYNPKIRSLFKQLICETDCLYERVTKCLVTSHSTASQGISASSSNNASNLTRQALN